MPNELKHLILNELSLVDRPANPLAMAPIFKRDTSNEVEMTKEELEKLNKDLEDAVAKADKLAKDNERLRKSLLDNGFVITADTVEKKQTEEMIDVGGEKVAKSAIPAPVLKALEAAEKERVEAAVAKRAQETLPNFDQNVAKKLVAMDLDEDTVKALKAADAMFETQMKEIGKDQKTGDMSDPKEAYDALVTKTMADEGLDYVKAYEKVSKTPEGKTLLNKFYKKDN